MQAINRLTKFISHLFKLRNFLKIMGINQFLNFLVCGFLVEPQAKHMGVKYWPTYFLAHFDAYIHIRVLCGYVLLRGGLLATSQFKFPLLNKKILEHFYGIFIIMGLWTTKENNSILNCKWYSTQYWAIKIKGNNRNDDLKQWKFLNIFIIET